jgi:23S rRNA pseudouridine2605 synthase
MESPAKISLSKYLSVCGIASRRKSCELIKTGLVKVNSEIITEPGYKISPGDQIRFEDKILSVPQKVYIMLNKPRGYVCTSEDPHAPRKALDLIKLPPSESGIRLFSAGRLDKESEGLLIFTNDGEYAEKIMHPRYEILKSYIVTTNIEIPDLMLNKIRQGINDENEFLKPQKITRDGNCRYTFVLNEGKKREIRRLVKFTGAKVKSLKRVTLGTLELGTLASGKWRYLSAKDINAGLINPDESK